MKHAYCFVFTNVGHPPAGQKQYNLSTIAVVRSLGRQGIPVVLLTTSKQDAATQSRYARHVELCPLMLDSEETLLEHLLKLADKYPGEKVFLPSVDECAYFTGKYHDALSQKYVVPAPDKACIEKINNKKFQYESASKLNIPIPETYFPETPEAVETLAEQLTNYPYVIKPNVSFEWKMKSKKNKSQGKKGFQANNKEELVQFTRDIYVPGFDFMVQEVIGGRDERLVTFLGYFGRDAKAHSWFIRRKKRQSPIDFGYCTFTESCHNDQVFDQSVQLLKELRYHGIAGVEWKLDPDTDTYKLIEINGRPVNTTGCAMASGIDLPAIAYFDALGQNPAQANTWEDGQSWSWLAMDIWAASEWIKLGKLSWREWFAQTRGIKADAVFAWDDMCMSLRYYFPISLNVVKALFLKLLKR